MAAEIPVCEPTRRRYGGPFADRGYCRACLGVIERQEAAKNWNRERSDTRHHIYLDASIIKNRYSAEDFETYRNEFIRQAELRLAQLREIEGKRQGRIPVDGTDIEDLRAQLLNCIRHKAKFRRDSQYIENSFNA